MSHQPKPFQQEVDEDGLTRDIETREESHALSKAAETLASSRRLILPTSHPAVGGITASRIAVMSGGRPVGIRWRPRTA